MLHRAATSLFVLTALSATAAAQSTFAGFESGPVHPLRISADGSRLFACDTTGGRLCVFDLRAPRSPLLLAEIPVGIDPVSVQPRTADEVWVANLLSDTISIVSLARGCVIDTVHVKDEPSDIVFAQGLAFVSTATTDDVKVFDATTRTLVATVPVFGKDPRALAVSANGTRVYAVVQRSGNGTTVIPEHLAPPPPLPTNLALPPAPRQGLIVRADDPSWQAHIPFTLPDHDVAEIDVATRTVVRHFGSVGTTNTGIAVHPQTGELWVANTDARNVVRFEPNLRGHCIDSRLTRITTGAAPVVTPFDLNPGINYQVLPNIPALGTALAEPFDVALDATAGLLYVAAQGSDRIGVVDRNGNVVARIEVGNTPGALVDTRNKRGPRGLALHPTAPLLYVQNRLSDTISVIDTALRAVTGELPVASHDAMPAAMRTGRKFLFDSKLSGNGTMSCASCHVDGDMDGLAWDLGDPGGSMQNPPVQQPPFQTLVPFHPMKGPMVTQTLRGLAQTGPLHWRGDKPTFQDFNPAFQSLMGGLQLATADMNLFAASFTTVVHPPNPNQQLDRRFRITPGTNNEYAGFQAFQISVSTGPPLGTSSCNTCHSLPSGTNGQVINGPTIQQTQQAKAPQLRNLYRKTGFNRAPGPQKSGFGFFHDGHIDTLTSFMSQLQFSIWPNAIKDDLVTFLLAFDTGTAPMCGYQVTMTQQNATASALAADQQLLMLGALYGHVDLVAKGLLDGRHAGLLYQPGSQLWFCDRLGEGPFTLAALQAKALQGNATLTFTGVLPGSGIRLGIDRDLDGTRDGDEGVLAYGTGNAGCTGLPQLGANSEPRLGNQGFAMVADHAPLQPGLLLTGLRAGNVPYAGLSVLVDLAGPTQLVFLLADAHGTATMPLSIPPTPGLQGAPLFGQTFWLDACATAGFASSRGLQLIVQP